MTLNPNLSEKQEPVMVCYFNFIFSCFQFGLLTKLINNSQKEIPKNIFIKGSYHLSVQGFDNYFEVSLNILYWSVEIGHFWWLLFFQILLYQIQMTLYGVSHAKLGPGTGS